ncbi:hypothetical protein [Leisingera sp. S232]|uniref:hypothetical protein n=1 Tax=Leisingera sp. S232 TaxID=3415132 RepID=UPI00086F4C40|nr:hypothetical protein AB838_12940 [Rhodobacteraceae bacterium (ex Bugula neritina AB1)]
MVNSIDGAKSPRVQNDISAAPAPASRSREGASRAAQAAQQAPSGRPSQHSVFASGGAESQELVPQSRNARMQQETGNGENALPATRPKTGQPGRPSLPPLQMPTPQSRAAAENDLSLSPIFAEYDEAVAKLEQEFKTQDAKKALKTQSEEEQFEKMETSPLKGPTSLPPQPEPDRSFEEVMARYNELMKSRREIAQLKLDVRRLEADQARGAANIQSQTQTDSGKPDSTPADKDSMVVPKAPDML